ncbi:TCP-1/cpn60 chaperonin family protein [Candidatus Woesearchaeota archaeon]|nr:TCP-1/cpn60 chaperonin family protein [Candidatus Woesearchaeota archaeon]
MSNNVQPIFILPEGTQRSIGRDAQRTNIMAAKLVAETIRTTLGPKGMDKMIVDSSGDITITNDGVTILEEMQIEHPSAKMIVEVAKTQEDEVGDGTTTAVVLAGELLKNAEELLDQDVHPAVLARGFRLAAIKANEILENISEPISEKDEKMLRQIAMTAMTGKGAETAKEKLSEITVKAVKEVMDKENNNVAIDKDNIKLEKKHGGRVDETELVQGIVLDKERAHASMPISVKNAKILLLDSALEIKDTTTTAKIKIKAPLQMQTFLEQEEKMLKGMAEKISNSGANVVFCQKGIDDIVQHFLAKKGIYAATRVKESDMKALTRATGASIVSNLDSVTEKDLGKAGLVEEARIGDDNLTFVRECKNPKSVTVLIKGSTEHVVDEIQRAMEDAIGDVSAALKDGKVVAGAGSTEAELARQLRKFSESLSGREQLAAEAFAKAVEVIPRTLAENAGLDPIDVLTDLRAAHDKKQKWAGIDVFTGRVIDAWQKGIIEPLKIKTQAVSSASEVAIMILRIDDVVAGAKKEMPMPPMPQGMGGMGMGGMPPMM